MRILIASLWLSGLGQLVWAAPNLVTGDGLEPLPQDERDPISHLMAVVRGTRKPNGLSSLENNLIATEILDAARESARTGKRVALRAR